MLNVDPVVVTLVPSVPSGAMEVRICAMLGPAKIPVMSRVTIRSGLAMTWDNVLCIVGRAQPDADELWHSVRSIPTRDCGRIVHSV